MSLTPKMWAGGAVFMGLLVIVTGFLSLRPQNASTKQRDPDCSPSPMVYATIVLGVAMLCAGAMYLAKLRKAATAGGGAMDGDMPTPDPDMGGDAA